MDETWRDIDGYVGHYQVSNLGRVRSVKKSIVILKGDKQGNGYKRVYLWKDGRKKNKLVHRLVADAFVDNEFNLKEVNHIDEDKENNNANNLEWCNHTYNMNYGNVKEKISNSNKGRKLSFEHIEKLRLDTSRRRWINDGYKNRYVYAEDLDNFIDLGWSKGRIYKRRNFNYVRKGQPVSR